MPASSIEESVQTIHIKKEIEIAAPLEIVFESVLDEIGPASQMPDGTPFPMKLEPWPGGRWFRDLGNDAGHLWGHVQVIKPPKLIEICGPMFMSYPATNFVQYRLVEQGSSTLLKVTHRALGLIPTEDREGVQEGWEYGLKRIKELSAERLARRAR